MTRLEQRGAVAFTCMAIAVVVILLRAGVARAKASGTKSGKAFGRPECQPRRNSESVTLWRLLDAPDSTRSPPGSAWRLGRCSESRLGREWTPRRSDARYGDLAANPRC
jgi:hypothetical protein